MVKSKFNPQNRNFNKKIGYKMEKSKDKMKDKAKGKTCFCYQEKCHFIKDCLKRLNDMKNKSKIDEGATLVYKDEADVDGIYVAINCQPNQE